MLHSKAEHMVRCVVRQPSVIFLGLLLVKLLTDLDPCPEFYKLFTLFVFLTLLQVLETVTDLRLDGQGKPDLKPWAWGHWNIKTRIYCHKPKHDQCIKPRCLVSVYLEKENDRLKDCQSLDLQDLNFLKAKLKIYSHLQQFEVYLCVRCHSPLSLTLSKNRWGYDQLENLQ